MRTLTHLVVTDNFAGVERYITVVSRIAQEHGWSVRVLGGREKEMRRELPDGVHWAPARTMTEALRTLRRGPMSEVMHVHLTTAEIASAVVRRGEVVVATRHFAAAPGSTPPARLAFGWAARRVDSTIAISETVRRACGDPSMPVLLLGVPVNDRPRQPERTVVVAQRLELEKRTADVVRAFARSGIAEQGWSLRIHGEGAEHDEVRAAMRAAGLGDSAVLLGWHSDMPSLLAGAGIVVASADGEPLGLVVAEAMAAGAPVLASAAAGHLETLGHAPDARLYIPRDVEDCARQLRALAEQPAEEREAYGAGLRAHQRLHLNAETHGEQLLAHYERVLEAR